MPYFIVYRPGVGYYTLAPWHPVAQRAELYSPTGEPLLEFIQDCPSRPPCVYPPLYKRVAPFETWPSIKATSIREETLTIERLVRLGYARLERIIEADAFFAGPVTILDIDLTINFGIETPMRGAATVNILLDPEGFASIPLRAECGLGDEGLECRSSFTVALSSPHDIGVYSLTPESEARVTATVRRVIVETEEPPLCTLRYTVAYEGGEEASEDVECGLVYARIPGTWRMYSVAPAP